MYKGQPYKQGHIEKYNRTIQEEFIDQNERWLDNITKFNKKNISLGSMVQYKKISLEIKSYLSCGLFNK